MKQPIILVNIVNGDPKTLDTLYTVLYPKIVSFILKNSGSEDDAADVFQKALLQLSVRFRKEGLDIDNVEGYIFSICKNLWRRQLNTKKTVSIEDGIYHLKDESRDLAEATVEQERWELFRKYLQKLKGKCKEVLQLFFSHHSGKEIAAALDYNSELIARQQVYKCKKKLTEAIQMDATFKKLME